MTVDVVRKETRSNGERGALARSWHWAPRTGILPGRWSQVCSSLLAYLSLGNLVGLARRKERHLRVWSKLLTALAYYKDTMSWVRCLTCGAQAGHRLVREGPRGGARSVSATDVSWSS